MSLVYGGTEALNEMNPGMLGAGSNEGEIEIRT